MISTDDIDSQYRDINKDGGSGNTALHLLKLKF